MSSSPSGSGDASTSGASSPSLLTSKVKLQTNDNEKFEVDVRIAKLFGVVKNMMQDLGFEENPEKLKGEIIPLNNVDSKVFAKILEWVQHYKDNKEALEGEDPEISYRTDNIPDWDKEFLTKDKATIFGIMQAANYLDVKGLLDICCKTVANMLKGKSVEAVRREFNIENDFTPEEEEQIRLENEWFEDRDSVRP